MCPKWFPCPWYIWRKLCTYLAWRLSLSPNGLKQPFTSPTSPRSPIGASKMIFEPMVCSAQTVHLSCVNISTISKRSDLSLEPHHLVAPSSVSKMISERMVRLAQTMHQSCTDTNTISKRKEARFHMTQVTYEFHRVCAK